MLNKMLKWRKKNSKGFSLVELIIVIAIMAILVGILAPQFIKYVEQSRQSTDIKNYQEIISAVQVYCADTHTGTGTDVIPKGSSTFTMSKTTGGVTAATSPSTDFVGAAMTSAGMTVANIKGQSTLYGGATLTATVDATTGAVTFTVKATNADANDTTKDTNIAKKLGVTQGT
jgi:type IV pilus assembly protein PilA